MNKKFKLYFVALLGVVFVIAFVARGGQKEVEKYGYAESTASVEAAVLSSNTSSEANQTNQSKIAKSDTKQAPSRGGLSVSKVNEVAKKSSVTQNKTATQNSSSIQTVDWWSKGRYAFAIGAIAEVQDFYTGKKFKLKRTMGSNHADVETLTKEDTDIVKSIWGGFSWERRPVILNINGKRYAASMSAMPHAGLDSSPAYVTVSNRSGGYGSGQNLDVIKGNGMDGHMDVHFLNSTRHKDGRVDPQHQSAISKLASK